MSEPTIPTTVSVAPIDGAAISADADAAYAVVTSITIDSDDMYAVAADELADIKAKARKLEEQRVSMTSGLNNVVKQINALFKPAIERLGAGEAAIKSAMLKYQSDQEAKRREEQRIANEIAEANRKRMEQEAAELAAQAQAQAGTAEAQEKIAQANALIEEAAFVAPVTVSVSAPAVKGLSTAKTWKCRLPESEQDKINALEYIAKHPEFLHLIAFDQSAANALAKATKARFPVPGFKPFEDASIRSRS